MIFRGFKYIKSILIKYWGYLFRIIYLMRQFLDPWDQALYTQLLCDCLKIFKIGTLRVHKYTLGQQMYFLIYFPLLGLTFPTKLPTDCCAQSSYMSGRVKFKDFVRAFKYFLRACMYQPIQALNTGLEISKMWCWIVQNATFMSFKQLCQIWTCKINSNKMSVLNVR